MTENNVTRIHELLVAELLCNGINPETGEILNTPRNPKVDQARLNYLKALQDLNRKMLKEEKVATSDKPDAPPNQGAKWTGELDAHLLQRWLSDDQPTLDILADYFGRTDGAIASRLVKLRVAADTDEIREQNRTRKEKNSS